MKKLIEWLGDRYDLVVLLMMLGCVLCLIFSCTATKAVEESRTEYVEKVDFSHAVDSLYKSMFRKDSIYIHDSVVVREKADTIYYYKYYNEVRTLTNTDTVYITKVDTVRKNITAEVREKKDTTRHAPWKIVVGAVVAFVLAFGLVRLVDRIG